MNFKNIKVYNNKYVNFKYMTCEKQYVDSTIPSEHNTIQIIGVFVSFERSMIRK